ncbi:MAG: cytochrome c biogenesis protein CcdA [Anaerolineae bacterium]
MGDNVTLGLAFFAGFLSFVSPCVLPLIPAYISYLTGRAAQQSSLDTAGAGAGVVTMSGGIGGAAAVKVKPARLVVVMHGVFFVLGFTVVFVVFGIITGAGTLALRRFGLDIRDTMRVIGGILVIFFGLHILGLTGWVLRHLLTGVKWEALGEVGSGIYKALEWLQTALYGDTRRQMNPHSPYGYLGSALMGVFFAAGWSPCLGPILGAILSIAANASLNGDSGGSVGQAAYLLTAYSLGLGVPFLLAAFALDRMRGLMRSLQKRMHTIEIVSGVFLIIIGVMLLTNTLFYISQAGGGLADFSYNLESCATGVFEGDVPLGDLGTCLQLGINYKEINSQVGTAPSVQATPVPDNASASPDNAGINVMPTGQPNAANLAVGLSTGQLAPDFTVKLVTGDQVSLSSLRGRVVLLNFWATWCAPCIKEMPDFQKLADGYSPDQFVVLAVNYREDSDTISKFATKNNLTFDLALDLKGEISRQFQVSSYPVSYVIGRDGVILGVQIGAFKPNGLDTLKGWIEG